MSEIDEIRRLLTYDQSTGLFRWRGSPSNFVKAGRAAGSLTDRGYLRVMLKGKSYLAHRLAWLIVHGEWPRGEIDHINGVRVDNRMSNLRAVSRNENSQNLHKAPSNNKSSGLLGASFVKQCGRWVARIRVDGKRIHLGHFATAEQAHQAYLDAKRRLHPACSI